MPKYVDGFVLPIPKKNIARYVAVARKCAKIWIEHGALEYYECMAEDVEYGKSTSFPRAVKLKPTEVSFFSYITYKSRAHRDAVNKKVMKDPRLKMDEMMPFDGKRMIYGGFKVKVTALAKKGKKR